MVCGLLPSLSQTRFFCIYILSPKPCCPVLFLTRQALENPSLCNLRPNSTIFFTRSLFHLLFRVTFAMPSYNGSKHSTIVHQNPSRSSSTYYSNNSSGSRPSSHSTHSHTTTYTMDYSTSSGPYGHDQAQYRSPYAKDYNVDVSRHGSTVVINHHRPNPSTDEPRASESRGAFTVYGNKHKDDRRKDNSRN
ncbi:hypothetical protein QC762_505280 [Podospora pseudocomata]|uniref:Uncharacterized protein n=1 Tax=Podospora pseudocomata TaxID=2093779 RepID=A0ABR0GBK2_9PEZI|nr:hypothetical protein QC762_505280 [Podospora pseudocomata]